MSSGTTIRRHKKICRPPRDPSAGVRPNNALERAVMDSAFRQKVQAANSVTICNAISGKVGRLAIRTVLSSDKFCVPIFQRRYCWAATQWQTLLEDAIGTTTSRTHQHSLGRLTCTNSSSVPRKPATNSTRSLAGTFLDGRSCILDGQQRITTVTILLASIRDLLEERLARDNDQQTSIEMRNSISLINNLLFIDEIQLQDWINRPNTNLEEGMELEFARLVPTYCDRWSYYVAILPKRSPSTLQQDNETVHSSSWNRPLQAKRYFMTNLRESHNTTPKQLISVLQSVLDNLTMLYFPVDINQSYDDGTEDLMVIYERLAMRDATFCKPSRKTEYQTMDGADMIRNLMLGSFVKQTDALEFYKSCWIPLEQQANQHDKTMGDLIQSFLEQQQKQNNESSDTGAAHESINKKGIIGGQIYADFQAWFTAQHEKLADTTTMNNMGASSSEQIVRDVGQQLLDFATQSNAWI